MLLDLSFQCKQRIANERIANQCNAKQMDAMCVQDSAVQCSAVQCNLMQCDLVVVNVTSFLFCNRNSLGHWCTVTLTPYTIAVKAIASFLNYLNTELVNIKTHF